MKPFKAQTSDFRTWLTHPTTRLLMAVIERERSENALNFTTNVLLGRDSGLIVQELAKLKGIQEIWEVFSTEGMLKEVLLDPVVDWDPQD